MDAFFGLVGGNICFGSGRDNGCGECGKVRRGGLLGRLLDETIAADDVVPQFGQ